MIIEYQQQMYMFNPIRAKLPEGKEFITLPGFGSSQATNVY
jgi:hypothetical protein